jgi:hypothetical protein
LEVVSWIQEKRLMILGRWRHGVESSLSLVVYLVGYYVVVDRYFYFFVFFLLWTVTCSLH